MPADRGAGRRAVPECKRRGGPKAGGLGLVVSADRADELTEAFYLVEVGGVLRTGQGRRSRRSEAGWARDNEWKRMGQRRHEPWGEARRCRPPLAHCRAS